MAAPKLRFKEFDGDWSQSRIGEIFQVTSGSTPLRSDNRFFENADIAWVKTTDLNNGLIEKTEEKISQIALKETSVKILPKGTVFVAMYGGFNQIGRTGLLVDEAACNQALSAIYPNEKIESYFLLTFLNHKVDDWKNFAASSRKDPNITKSDVLAFPLTYPVKEEQTKIASFLSAVDEKISQLNQKHELLSQYKQGMMQKLFSQQFRFKADDGSEFGEWENKALNTLCSRSYQGINTVADKVEYQQSGYPILQAKHITSEKLDLVDVRYLSDLDYEKYKEKYIPNVNDILFSNIGTIGKVVLVDAENPFFIAWNIFLITPKETLITPLYLSSYLRWLTALNYFDNLQTGNATKFINKTDLLATVINLPCLAEQTKIANFLSAIDQKIEVVAQQIEQAKTWKKGLLQQMFV
ncbi:restriction endonuclease subunit S [Acinetobacter sp.]|uniref:restriction endonuclease subunit S n=1 Tax=Acinetobacter sp. TaxID=472 RepID=UPI0026472A1C|nr:restriction endonuclease subunit S [Acinetobacter sp.]MDN5512364.1 restriction endonuclease subunit S [Acinetobacter sp.]MDN5524873.1 restriction endonuclease subunit S [Acinetobacter sp.]